MYLEKKMGQKGVDNVVVKKGPFIHQNTFDIFCKNWIFTAEQFRNTCRQAHMRSVGW